MAQKMRFLTFRTSGKTSSCRKYRTPFDFEFSYLCPEPVLVKFITFVMQQAGQKRSFPYWVAHKVRHRYPI